ncbi:unnamed protein product, partial [Ranitomeya imitator]
CSDHYITGCSRCHTFCFPQVMKCIVEVISDTLSKPKPCSHQRGLPGDPPRRSHGETHEAEKDGGFVEELSGILEKQLNKPLPSAKSQGPALLENYPVRDEVKRQSEEEERKRSSERPEEDDSAEELESNEISKREETSEDEELDNRITDEINEMELPKDNQEDASERRTSEETKTKKDQEADGKEDSHKQDSKRDQRRGDETQREDNSMRFPEDSKPGIRRPQGNQTRRRNKTDCAEENPGVMTTHHPKI